MRKEHLINFSSLLISAGGAVTSFQTGNTLVLAGAVPLSYLIQRQATRRTRLEGRTRMTQISNSISSETVEFLGVLLAGLFVSNVSALVFALAALGFNRSVALEIEKRSMRDESVLGRRERIGVLALAYLGNLLNPYLIFYGLIVYGALALAEIIDILLKLARR